MPSPDSPSPQKPTSQSALPPWQGALLLRQIAGENERALESLSRTCGDRFYSMALHWVSDEQMACEIVQDTLLRIWKTAHRYDPARSAPFTWCCMILRGICLDHLRKKKRRPILLDDYELTLDLTEEVQIDDLLFHESLSNLRHAFSHLSAEERHVINAAIFDPRTVRQLAEQWELPPEAAKSRIRRAMAKLRTLLRKTTNLLAL